MTPFLTSRAAYTVSVRYASCCVIVPRPEEFVIALFAFPCSHVRCRYLPPFHLLTSFSLFSLVRIRSIASHKESRPSLLHGTTNGTMNLNGRGLSNVRMYLSCNVPHIRTVVLGSFPNLPVPLCPLSRCGFAAGAKSCMTWNPRDGCNGLQPLVLQGKRRICGGPAAGGVTATRRVLQGCAENAVYVKGSRRVPRASRILQVPAPTSLVHLACSPSSTTKLVVSERI